MKHFGFKRYCLRDELYDDSGRKVIRRLFRPGWLDTLRRTTPLSNAWGYDRGTPVDRYYIERFLEEHQPDIHGKVLEVKDSSYTRRYGTSVKQCDVLDIDSANPQANIIADLSAADVIPSNTFDCFILTQTLQLIYDTRAAIYHAHRILTPGGVLLVTVPSLSRIVPEVGLKTDYWRFTVASCSLLFSEVFGSAGMMVRSYGNVLTGVGFLMGMAHEELSRKELDTYDDYFPLIVAIRATKQ
jgi:hypothetical protein